MKKDSALYKIVLLGALCAICGLLLSAINGLTAPIIAEASLAAVKANLEEIYPGASFKEVTTFDDPKGLVTGVYEAEGKGTVYKVHNIGYNANGFTFLIAFNEDGTVGGFMPVEENETDGFGKRAFKQDFVDQILALNVDEQTPLLSGATLTTTAIQQGYDAAAALFKAAK